jgi:aryl sulfotransferase
MAETAKPSRIYQNHHLDSTRWQAVPGREGDIVIATSAKSGTTWMQAIVAHLLFPEGDFPQPPHAMSPWVDFRPRPLDELTATLEAQTHRRFLKSHLPWDGLPERPGTRWIYVCRDGRDMAVSLWHHYTGYTEERMAAYNGGADRVGPPLPPPPDDFLSFWRDWCTRGWFAWESDGWPFWSHLNTAASWWTARGRADVLMMHFADLSRDPAGSVERIAAHIDVPLTPAHRDAVVAATDFSAMKARGAEYVPSGGASWKNGVEGFMRSGQNRQWEGLLSAQDLDLYEAACDRVLSPACRRWMDEGGVL